MRKAYPEHFNRFLQIARAEGLTCPAGRALYACNRMQNGWPRSSDHLNQESEVVVLRRAKLATAKRWLKHWIKEGHVKSLRPHREELRLKRVRYARSMAIRRANQEQEGL